MDDIPKRFRKFTYWDIFFMKLSLIAFGILLAKLYPSLLGINTVIVFFVFIILAAKPLHTAFAKK